MGYTTNFDGKFVFDKQLTYEQKEYINKFSRSRRMKRDPEILMKTFKGSYTAPGRTDYGIEGEFFVGDKKIGIEDFNVPPSTQPGLWCQWITDGDQLEWDQGEKFYEYVGWLEYLIKNFFSVWGIHLNGEVYWSGEDSDDLGLIIVVNNVIIVKEGRITYD